MEHTFRLSINNKEIFEFYEKFNIDFEHMNLVFMSILKKLMGDLDTSLNTNMSSRLLDKINSIDNKIEFITSSVTTSQNNVSSSIEIKLNEYRKEYIENMKQILTLNNVEYIAPLIKETSNALLDKTSLMICDIIPKNQESLSKDIHSQFQVFQSSVVSETNKLVSSSLDKKTTDDFLNNISQSMSQSHNTLLSILSSSESRIENRLVETERKLNEIKEISTLNHSTQQTLYTNVSEILKKFEKGITKGTVSEHIVYNILLSLFPCAQIDHVGGEQKETGDIILIRNDKPKILIENKDHTSMNVPKTDVEKFIRDCEIQNCCGIMLAQHRGIANKNNFELQINNGNVLLYLHEVNFDKEKIKIAIDIVEQFKLKIDETFNNEDDCIIDKDVLYEINREFINYSNQKNNMVKLLRDFNDKMIFSINEFKVPTLEKYLSSKFASASIQSDNICNYCEKHIPKSLSQHYRHCQAKKDAETQKQSKSTLFINIEEKDTSSKKNNNVENNVVIEKDSVAEIETEPISIKKNNKLKK